VFCEGCSILRHQKRQQRTDRKRPVSGFQRRRHQGAVRHVKLPLRVVRRRRRPFCPTRLQCFRQDSPRAGRRREYVQRLSDCQTINSVSITLSVLATNKVAAWSNGQGLDVFCDAVYTNRTRDLQRSTMLEVAADWHEVIVLQRIT